MATDKPLKLDTNGNKTEFTGATSSSGAPDAGRLVALDSGGRIDPSMMPVGVTANVVACVAFEALAAGDFVNLFLDSGVLKARKADASAASASRRADGFVLAAVSASATATVYTDDTNSSVAGLTIGSDVFLSGSTPGGLTHTPVTTAGQILQRLGKATSATSISVEISDPVIRA